MKLEETKCVKDLGVTIAWKLSLQIDFSSPHITKNIAKLETAQSRGAKTIIYLCNQLYERGYQTKPVFFEKHCLHGNLMKGFEIFKDIYGC